MVSTERAGGTAAITDRLSFAEAFGNLQRELNGEPDVVPAGWMTTEQWSVECGNKSVQATRRTIQAAVKAGRMESQKFRIQNGERGLYPAPHYRIVEAK